MKLNDVNKGVHKNPKRLRVGRGPGSGRGRTAGRGNKGQGQLAGWSAPAIFEGGGTPLIRRIPKRGFHNSHGLIVKGVNVSAGDMLRVGLHDGMRDGVCVRDGLGVTVAVGDMDVHEMRRKPAARREYRVVRATGETVASGCVDDDEISIEPAFTVARDSATGRYKRVPR
jgi:hypothetical protein